MEKDRYRKHGIQDETKKKRDREIKKMKTGRQNRDRGRNWLRELIQLSPGRLHFGGNLTSRGDHMACWAGFALNCKEVHPLSNLRPLCLWEDGFWGQGHGNSRTHTSRPVCEGRGLDEVPRDWGVGRGLREAAPAPTEPGTKSICTQASVRQGWGPSCGTLGNSSHGTEPRSP